MNDTNSKLKIYDIYRIYTGDNLQKIIITVAATTALMSAIWYKNSQTLISTVNYIIFFLIAYIKSTEMWGIQMKGMFKTYPRQVNQHKSFRCISRIKEIHQKGYIVNYFIILTAIFTSVVVPAAVISALTGNYSIISNSFKIFSSYTLVIIIFSFIGVITDKSIKIICMIIAGFNSFIFVVVAPHFSLRAMITVFIISAAATPLALRTATNAIGKEYV